VSTVLRHNYEVFFDRGRVAAVCRSCGASTYGDVDSGFAATFGECPGAAATTHVWALGANAQGAMAACTRCGRSQAVPLSGGGVAFASLNLTGDCPEAA
jgi:hypothetical protein